MRANTLIKFHGPARIRYATEIYELGTTHVHMVLLYYRAQLWPQGSSQEQYRRFSIRPRDLKDDEHKPRYGQDFAAEHYNLFHFDLNLGDAAEFLVIID